MTNEQEIRAKSLELAMMLLGLLAEPNSGNNSVNIDNAKLYLDDIAELGKEFERIILDDTP